MHINRWIKSIVVVKSTAVRLKRILKFFQKLDQFREKADLRARSLIMIRIKKAVNVANLNIELRRWRWWFHFKNERTMMYVIVVIHESIIEINEIFNCSFERRLDWSNCSFIYFIFSCRFFCSFRNSNELKKTLTIIVSFSTHWITIDKYLTCDSSLNSTIYQIYFYHFTDSKVCFVYYRIDCLFLIRTQIDLSRNICFFSLSCVQLSTRLSQSHFTVYVLKTL